VVYTRDFAFGGQQLTEEIMRTYGLTMEEAGRAKKEGGLPGNYQAEVLDPFIDDMTQQVSRSLQFYLASGQRPRAAGEDPDLRRLRQHSRRRRCDSEPRRHPCRKGRSARADETSSARARAQAVQRDATALLTACGLALRSFD
jgi:type IV pilus assembly protein PilM